MDGIADDMLAGLPAELTGGDCELLAKHLSTLAETHQGNGLIGLWCTNRTQVFVAAIAEGKVAGWLLAPAADEATANRMRLVLGELIVREANEAGEDAARTAEATIRRMRLH